jgi:teichuronic acid biosynthesis glycosyltransferase TuaG
MSEAYSVVIPAYNSEKTIQACLMSVAAQTLAPLQVLVVDDASGDGTEAAVRRCEREFAAAGIELQYFRLARNAGPSAARNKGIREAAGNYIAFLDADDTWSSNKLAIVDRFVGATSAGLVCHDHADHHADHHADDMRQSGGAQTEHYRAQPLSLPGMLLRNPAQTSCAVARKQPALTFDETMHYCEDYDLWMRIAERCGVLRLLGSPLTCLGRPQLSAGGLSGNTLLMRIGEMRVYYNFCRRAWLYRVWLLPGLLAFSILKHVYSGLRRWSR